MKTKNVVLLIAAILSFCAAVFQLVISLVPKWSAFFGAGDELTSKPLMLLVLGLIVTVLLAIWGFYGLSGASLIRRLPLLRLVIFLIGAVYIFRGLPILLKLLELVKILPPSEAIELPGFLVFLGALIAGIFYWAGLAIGWKQLRLRIPATGD
ncbi:MAG TPA: hypothetical protein VLD65_09270 [Anaerolineales bacterium]|nr:hypothetical protein [Anaerolineales bacterium]